MALVFYTVIKKVVIVEKIVQRCVFDDNLTDAKLAAVHLPLADEKCLVIDMTIDNYDPAIVQAEVDKDDD